MRPAEEVTQLLLEAEHAIGAARWVKGEVIERDLLAARVNVFQGRFRDWRFIVNDYMDDGHRHFEGVLIKGSIVMRAPTTLAEKAFGIAYGATRKTA